MRSGTGRRLALIGSVLATAIVAGDAHAHPFPGWSGTSGPFAWQAKRLSCGAVGGHPSRLRAHSRWSSSPTNGYQRLTFVRQIRNEATGNWRTVQRERRSTRNTALEGTTSILHWWQTLRPFANEAGKKSRHRVTFEWFRKQPGPDPRANARTMRMQACIVGA
jgi:hypothetical protein